MRCGSGGRLHIKCDPAYFWDVDSGRKSFEIRRDDRAFQKGDVLRLREWKFKGDIGSRSNYSGQESFKEITYILTGGQFGLTPGYVAMAIIPLEID